MKLMELIRSGLAMMGGALMASMLWAVVSNATRPTDYVPGSMYFDTTATRAVAVVIGLAGVALIVLEVVAAWKR